MDGRNIHKNISDLAAHVDKQMGRLTRIPEESRVGHLRYLNTPKPRKHTTSKYDVVSERNASEIFKKLTPERQNAAWSQI